MNLAGLFCGLLILTGVCLIAQLLTGNTNHDDWYDESPDDPMCPECGYHTSEHLVVQGAMYEEILECPIGYER